MPDLLTPAMRTCLIFFGAHPSETARDTPVSAQVIARARSAGWLRQTRAAATGPLLDRGFILTEAGELRLSRDHAGDLGDAAPWREMDSAPKDRSMVLAMLRADMTTAFPAHAHLHEQAGLQVVVRHPGVAADGFDPGWNLAGPFGHGGWTDKFFSGWKPLTQTAVHPDFRPRVAT